MIVFFIILVYLICIIISTIIANGKGYSWILGLILGSVLGALGMLIVAILPNKSENKNYNISTGSIVYGLRVILKCLTR